MTCVYMCQNRANGKLYFGVTDHFNQRVSSHICSSRKPNCRFHHAIRKYGRNGFSWMELAETASREEAFLVERALIATFRSTDPEFGYNISEGGVGVRGHKASRKSQKGRVFTEEHRAKLREAWKNRPPTTQATRDKLSALRKGRSMNFSEEALRKISLANKGKKRSDEAKKRMSESQSGVPKPKPRRLSESTRRKMSVAHRGKRMSEEARQKLSAFHTGKKLSEETKAKMSAAHRGKRLSDETRRKMSVAKRGV